MNRHRGSELAGIGRRHRPRKTARREVFVVEDLPPLVISRPSGTRNSADSAAEAAVRAAELLRS